MRHCIIKSIRLLLPFILALINLFHSGTALANYFGDIQDALSERGVNLEAVLTGEYWNNTRGGLTRDDTYLGNLDLSGTFDFEKMGWWSDGVLFIYVLENHGERKLTESIIGDIQTASNIEAPRTTRIFELWYEQAFLDDHYSLLLGIHDFNSDFAVTEYGGIFINSSFGIFADLAGGGRPSIFPLAAPGVRLKASPDDRWQLLLGIYDGDPDSPDDVEHFPRFDFDRQGGVFAAGEIGYYFGQQGEGHLPGFVKIGAWTNTGDFDDVLDVDSEGDPVKRDGNYGAYLVADKMIYQRKENQGWGLFIQVGGVPDHLNEIEFYWGAGLVFKGLIPGREEDELGFGLARASISDQLVNTSGRDANEIVYEMTYNFVISEKLRIQPDVQFIENPGAEEGRRNAIAVGLRFEYRL